MASLFSVSPSLVTLPPTVTIPRTSPRRSNYLSTMVTGQAVGIQTGKLSIPVHTLKMKISCCIEQPETFKTVQKTICKQLKVDESRVTPATKFSDLGADSLDTVEIIMILEEKFGVSIGDAGAAKIRTVQDAVNVIEKGKGAA